MPQPDTSKVCRKTSPASAAGSAPVRRGLLLRFRCLRLAKFESSAGIAPATLQPDRSSDCRGTQYGGLAVAMQHGNARTGGALDVTIASD